MLVFSLALLIGRGELAGARPPGAGAAPPNGWMYALADSATKAPPLQLETDEQRRAKSKARLMAGAALVVLALLALAVALALVRAFKR